MNAPLTFTRPATPRQATAAALILRHYLGTSQLLVLSQSCRGEERQFFLDKLCELAARVTTMPKVYEQEPGSTVRIRAYEAEGLSTSDAQAVVAAEDKRGPIAHLHYFTGSCDWWITERDTTDEQHQAYGLADIGYGGELGYISIAELIDAGAELDLHFTPKPLKEVKT